MWRIVFRKEFLEVFRDRRMVFNLFLSPLIITPLMIVMVGKLGKNQAAEAKSQVIVVGVIGLERAPSLQEPLHPTVGQRLRFEPFAEVEKAEAAIRARQIPAAIVVAPDAEERFQNDESVPVTVLQDTGSQESLVAARRVQEFFESAGRLIVARRLRENGLSAQVAYPFQVGDQKISGSGGEGMLTMTFLLPYILALAAIMGGAFLAFDSVAGEKERGTLETLLVSPVSRRELAIGKFCAVVGIALVYGILSVVGLLWPHYVPLKVFSSIRGQLTMTPATIAALFLVQIPLTVLGAGVLLMISTISRNQKEAQTYMGPIMMVVSVLSLLSIFLKAETSPLLALAPILNAALVLKQALMGHTDVTFVVIACIASLVYATVAVIIAARLFDKESVLLKA